MTFHDPNSNSVTFQIWKLKEQTRFLGFPRPVRNPAPAESGLCNQLANYESMNGAQKVRHNLNF